MYRFCMYIITLPFHLLHTFVYCFQQVCIEIYAVDIDIDSCNKYSVLLYRWTRNFARFGRCFGNSTTTNLLYTSMCVHPKCYIHFLLLSGYMNTAIHAIMYTYYLLTILRPEIKANKELKKNITRIQMVIFFDYFTWLESFCLPVYDPLTISIQFPTNLWFCVYFLFNKFWGIFGCHWG